jgi:hypothetical protein
MGTQRWALGCISSRKLGLLQGQANQVHFINDDSLDIAMNLPIPCVVLL